MKETLWDWLGVHWIYRLIWEESEILSLPIQKYGTRDTYLDFLLLYSAMFCNFSGEFLHMFSGYLMFLKLF